jgi:hypothetical protein
MARRYVMQEIILLTGYTETEFNKLGHDENLRCCYRCKRTEKDKSAVINKEGVLFQGIKLLPLCVEIMDSNLLVKVFLCVECYLAREAERDEKAMHFPMEIFEREGLI